MKPAVEPTTQKTLLLITASSPDIQRVRRPRVLNFQLKAFTGDYLVLPWDGIGLCRSTWPTV
jgi:hypothetical protein